MRFVLDSNEYLFAFGVAKKPASVALLDALVTHPETHTIRVPRLIVDEIRRNLPGDIFREVFTLIRSLTEVDEDFVVPFELGTKYEQAGLKPADAFIAAYSEWGQTACLAPKTRRFPPRHKDLPFRIVTAEQCLRLIKEEPPSEL